LAQVQASAALGGLAQRLIRPTQDIGTPDAKIRLGFIDSVDYANWVCTALIGDQTTLIPGLPMLANAEPVDQAMGMFAQVGNEYTLIGMLFPYPSVWTSYVSTMTSSGGGLVATSTARYRDIGMDREVEIRSAITTLGTAGVFNWNLPSAPASPLVAWDPVGVATAVDTSASLRVGLTSIYTGGSNVSMTSSTARVSNTTPFAAAVGDTYSLRATYPRV
jgi:hypothetical protein